MTGFEHAEPASPNMTVVEAERIEANARGTAAEIPYPVSGDATTRRNWFFDNCEA